MRVILKLSLQQYAPAVDQNSVQGPLFLAPVASRPAVWPSLSVSAVLHGLMVAGAAMLAEHAAAPSEVPLRLSVRPLVLQVPRTGLGDVRFAPAAQLVNNRRSVKPPYTTLVPEQGIGRGAERISETDSVRGHGEEIVPAVRKTDVITSRTSAHDTTEVAAVARAVAAPADRPAMTAAAGGPAGLNASQTAVSAGESMTARSESEATLRVSTTPTRQAPETAESSPVQSNTVLQSNATRIATFTDAASQPTAGVRVTHPANGRFDMVVVQTDLADLLPSSRDIMAGQPVYTVYLQVGDSREWVLHFCPADGKTVQNGSIVKLGDPRPLAPPYPKVTVLPARTPRSQTKVILVHGFIDETGTMRSLRVLGSDNDVEPSENLLAALAQWQFRPARRGADATSVEVLLAVPTTRM